MEQQSPQRVPKIVSIGYDGVDGIYVPGARVQRASKEEGMHLTCYGFPDARWLTPWHHFSSHQIIDLNRLMPCVESGFAGPSYLWLVRWFTQDLCDIDDNSRAMCPDGYRWLSPARRTNASICVLYITEGGRWSLEVALQRAIDYNVPLVIGIG
jgi:hypothetical protein